MTSHHACRLDWAVPLIGRPWSKIGQGPKSFSCWGLVRHFARVRLEVDFPMVFEDEGNFAPIRQAAELAGMTRAAAGDDKRFGSRFWIRPAHEDIVVMRLPSGRTHVGIVLRANGRSNVLHSFEGAGVCLEPWTEAVAGTVPELWRMRR